MDRKEYFKMWKKGRLEELKGEEIENIEFELWNEYKNEKYD